MQKNADDLPRMAYKYTIGSRSSIRAMMLITP